tara:strand:- start:9807 stop:9998 length:192 start_codon:yes stop_codon:yes gene_type:complete
VADHRLHRNPHPHLLLKAVFSKKDCMTKKTKPEKEDVKVLTEHLLFLDQPKVLDLMAAVVKGD